MIVQNTCIVYTKNMLCSVEVWIYSQVKPGFPLSPNPGYELVNCLEDKRNSESN